MFVVKNKTFFKWFTAKWVNGIALFPFVIVKHDHVKENKILINHELIHIKQQLELFILPFFIWYGFEYLYRLVQYRNSNRAYRNISFEREAYANESNLNYLKKRSIWSFLKYL